METDLEEAEWAHSRYDHLNFIEKKILVALYHGQCYQKLMARAYDKKVKPWSYKEANFVLKMILSFKVDPRGKFKPTFEGPML